MATRDPFNEHLRPVWAALLYDAPFRGGPHRAATIADINRDGIPDVAIAEDAAGLLGIVTGVGDGTLNAAPSTFTQIGQVTQLLPVDANGDGKLDIIATAFVSNGNVGLLINRGNGSFDVSAAAVPSSVLAAGLSSAGHPGRVDVVTVDFSGTIQSIPILASGTLGQAVQIGSPFTGVGSAVAGDFNHDGRLDFALGSSSSADPGSVTLLLGRSDGTFTTLPSIAVSGGVQAVAAADFNGDGNLDLVVSHGELKFNSTLNNNRFAGGTLMCCSARATAPSRRR